MAESESSEAVKTSLLELEEVCFGLRAFILFSNEAEYHVSVSF